MFPDPTLRWRPYPSMMDGLHAPYVFVQGLYRRILHLTVFGAHGAHETFGIQIECEMFSGYEELLYSSSGHSDDSSNYRGDVYIKQAKTSALLTTFEERAEDFQIRRSPRHFLFVGADYCYETIGYFDPVIRTFELEQQARDWKPGPIEEAEGERPGPQS